MVADVKMIGGLEGSKERRWKQLSLLSGKCGVVRAALLCC